MKNRKNDTRFHEEMKQASTAVYGKSRMPAGYTRVSAPVENKKNGFYAEVCGKGNDIVIVYRGTEIFSGRDLVNDVAMARGNIPAQATDALELHDKVKRENPNADITVTGHSLGGSLAQVVSGIRGTESVTFNAYGTGNLFKDSYKLKTDNITNYVNEYDSLAMANVENNIGDTYAVTKHTEGIFKDHLLEDMPPLESRIKRTTEELLQVKEELHSGKTLVEAKEKIEKLEDIKGDIVNSVDIVMNTVGNKVEGIKDNVSQAVKNRVQQGKDIVVSGVNKVKNAPQVAKNKLNQIKQCAGSYFVSGYTREDGTEVEGYTRTCGRHGG